MNEDLEKAGIRIEQPVTATPAEQRLPAFYLILFALSCIFFAANAIFLLNELSSSPTPSVSQSGVPNSEESAPSQSLPE